VIKAVLFDLDGTLYDRDRVAEALFVEQYDAFAEQLRGLVRERFLTDVHEMDEHGHGEKESGYRRLVQAWGLEPELAQRLADHFWAIYDKHMELPRDTSDTLRELRGRGLKLGIVTNGPSRRQRRKIATLGLADSFDVIVVSGEEGVHKPAAELFRRALARCGVAAHEALFVGDHPVADVAGAHEAGLKAVWKAVPYWAPVVAEAPAIRLLSELIAMCET
jgi:putative hydrolase of the HAD superfamily